MKKILSIGLVSASMLLCSCGDYLDINQNPNYPTDITIEGLIPSAQVYSGSNLGYEVQLVGAFWSQHYTQYSSSNQYNNIMQNNLTYSNSFFSAVWNRYYSNAIPTLRSIAKKANEGGADFLSQKVMAETMIAFDLHLLTSLFDQVAYENGGGGESNLTPTFETGKQTHNNILTILEQIRSYDPAAVLAAAEANSMGKKDLVFAGNADAWLRFANSLYLKMLMREFSANQSKIEALLAEDNFLNETSGDAKLDIFSDLPNMSNPLYESDRRQLNTPNNIRSCNSVHKVLAPVKDPRDTVYFETNSSGVIKAAEYGQTASSSSSTKVVLAATDPVYFMSVAEVYFMKAEAYARLSKAAEAKDAYNKGIASSFMRWGFRNAADFTAAGKPYEYNSVGTMEQQIEQIITQKWIAAVRCQSWDSWFDLLRTGYPKRSSSVAGNPLNNYTGYLPSNTYPARFLYPKRSSDYNPNTPAVLPLETKMWWHK